MQYGWTYKQFKTQSAMNSWIERNKSKVQYVEIFVNNAFALEYKKLIRIY